MKQRIFLVVTAAILTFGIMTNCTKHDVQEQKMISEEPVKNSAGANARESGSVSIVPLEICQKAYMVDYTLDTRTYEATVTSLDPVLDQGVFKLIYYTPDSIYFSFKAKNYQTLYFKQIKSGATNASTIYYENEVYNFDTREYDDAPLFIQNLTAYALLMEYDLYDYLEIHTPRAVYNGERVQDYTAIGFGGYASSSLARAQASISRMMSFYGCTNLRILYTDTSCWPLNSHGFCVTTIEYTANCPWYAGWMW